MKAIHYQLVTTAIKGPQTPIEKIKCVQQDSKELSPRSLDKMLLKRQINSQNVQSTQLSKFFKYSKLSKLSIFFRMISKLSKLVQIQYDHTILKHVQTCLNLFKFNMI